MNASPHALATPPAHPPGRLLVAIEHFREAVGGAEKNAVAMCQGMLARGWEVHVAALDGESLPGITLHQVPDWGAWPALCQQVQPTRTISWGFLVPADFCRLEGAVQAAFQAYDRRSYSGVQGWLRDLRQAFGKDSAEVAMEQRLITTPGTQFLPMSQLVAAQLVTHGAPANAVHLLYNAVDLEHFHPSGPARAKRAEWRARWGVPEDAVVALFVAHNLRLKNLALAMTVVERLHREFPPLHLVVVGKRAPPRRAPWLHWAGACTAMDEVNAAGDLLLHPTWYDAFANVVLEAMASGLAVLVSQDAGAAELLDGHNGLTLPVRETAPGGPGILAQWCEALWPLLQEPARRQAMGAAARRRAEDFTLAAYLDAWEERLRPG
jgi:UDP-glucose:(heptosyl)LPS alpha-1,3-glucosyltransferase